MSYLIPDRVIIVNPDSPFCWQHGTIIFIAYETEQQREHYGVELDGNKGHLIVFPDDLAREHNTHCLSNDTQTIEQRKRESNDVFYGKG